jgi:hypothetical protein
VLRIASQQSRRRQGRKGIDHPPEVLQHFLRFLRVESWIVWEHVGIRVWLLNINRDVLFHELRRDLSDLRLVVGDPFLHLILDLVCIEDIDKFEEAEIVGREGRIESLEGSGAGISSL